MSTFALFLAVEVALSDGSARISGAVKRQATGLYTDAQVERLVGKGITELKDQGYAYLDVVPEGATSPRGKVFKALGIKENRLRDRRSHGGRMILVLTWQISPSYDISFTSALGDFGPDFFDPKNKVYGVMIWKRETSRK